MREQERIVQRLVKEKQDADLKQLVESYIPLQVQVVISKYQGEKKIASAPYVLSVNANDNSLARLRVGAEVPLPMASVQETNFMAHNIATAEIVQSCESIALMFS